MISPIEVQISVLTDCDRPVPAPASVKPAEYPITTPKAMSSST
jgi:hypothetical protein